MAILTHAALIALAVECLSPSVVPIIAGKAEHENPQRDMMAVNRNANGTADYGLAQINSSNFPMLSKLFSREVNADNIRSDGCLNLRAAEAILFVRFNGNPSPAAGAVYAANAEAAVRRIEATLGLTASAAAAAAASPSPCAPAWDAWAIAACGKTSGHQ